MKIAETNTAPILCQTTTAIGTVEQILLIGSILRFVTEIRG